MSEAPLNLGGYASGTIMETIFAVTALAFIAMIVRISVCTVMILKAYAEDRSEAAPRRRVSRVLETPGI